MWLLMRKLQQSKNKGSYDEVLFEQLYLHVYIILLIISVLF